MSVDWLILKLPQRLCSWLCSFLEVVWEALVLLTCRCVTLVSVFIFTCFPFVYMFSLCPYFLIYEHLSVIRIETTLATSLEFDHLQKLYFQLRPHSQELEVRAASSFEMIKFNPLAVCNIYEMVPLKIHW